VKIIKVLAILTIIVVLFNGCTSKNNRLFNKNIPLVDNYKNMKIPINESYKIKSFDRLSIIFFEYPELSTKNKDRSENDIGIEVSSEGKIMMPLIGKILVSGKSKEEVVDMLYDRYSEYLEKPALRVEILNQKIYVLGEVKNPGSVNLLSQREITPLKAIVERGGLTDFAQRDIIKVVRGTEKNYRIFSMDLTDMQSFSENNIELLPNDIVYVAHNSVKDFNIPLSGASPSLSWINTLFSTLTLYQALR